jgi:hypothetical protein
LSARPCLPATTAAVKPGQLLAAVDSFRMSKSALANKAINRVEIPVFRLGVTALYPGSHQGRMDKHLILSPQ